MKICKYCGTENNMSAKTCTSCGGYDFKNKCSNCGTIFEEGNFCSKCGVKAGVRAKKCPNCDAEYYSVACPDCGYTKNSDSITEVYITRRSEPEKDKKTWLWVLGWLLIFPVPVTILLLRNKKLNKWIKGVIISLAWLVFIAMITSAPKSNNKQVKTGESQQERATTITESEKESDKKETEFMYASDEVVNKFITAYNKISKSPLEYIEKGNIRTKYFASSYGYSLEILNAADTEKIFVSIYVTANKVEEGVAGMREVFHDIVKVIDPNLSDDEIYVYFDNLVKNEYMVEDDSFGNIEITYIPEKKLSGGYSRGRIDLRDIS